MPTRREAIKRFLLENAPEDLADLYNPGMEVQVLVSQDGGDIVSGSEPKNWTGFTDGVTTWKNFRIPFDPAGEAWYKDTEMNFDPNHFESVGMTGWNWEEKRSKYVGFDFDSLVGHKVGLTADQLDEIKTAVRDIPWCEIRRSKGALGLHVYVYLDVETETHTEHAALARAVLAAMDSLVPCDLKSTVDKLGGVLWVYHRKTAEGGLHMIKRATERFSPPDNWRDHVHVVEGRGQRIKGVPSEIDELVDAMQLVQLDKEHRKLIDWLGSQPDFSVWDIDRRMLTTHTKTLERAHKTLNMRGLFHTMATGKDLPNDKNCFLFPLRDGAWIVRRFTTGIDEAGSWTKDQHGWTKCVLNQTADISTAASAYSGIESARNEYVFRTATQALQALAELTDQRPALPDILCNRTAMLVPTKDSTRIVLRVKREASMDPAMPGWLPNKRGDFWEAVVHASTRSEVPEPPDEEIRHVIASGEEAGWYVNTRSGWILEPRSNCVSVMKSKGLKIGDIEKLLGLCILNPWELTVEPFGPEYPGNRRWNRESAQLAFQPMEGTHPTWDNLLRHTFGSLDDWLDGWCSANGLETGEQYGLAWVAGLLQHPFRPLPYLFLHGPQNSGKSTFHEALRLLFAGGRGVVRADTALKNQEGFNGELAGAVLGVVEEVDLRSNRGAYNRIKDWTTGRTIAIHPKGKTVYVLPNTLHFIQCANRLSYCPVESGDTRITMCYIDVPTEIVGKDELLGRLREEAPAFLHTALNFQLPFHKDRMTIPWVETGDKITQADANKSELERFIDERCFTVPGASVGVKDFYSAFFDWLPIDQHAFWSSRRIQREMPTEFPKGRMGKGHWFYGNISLTEAEPGPRLQIRGDRLV